MTRWPSGTSSILIFTNDPFARSASTTPTGMPPQPRPAGGSWSCPSVMPQRSLAWRSFMPWVSLGTEFVGVLIQLLHIRGIELLIVWIVKVRSDVRKVEICSVLPRSQVDPAQIADSLRLNQHTDSPSADAQSAALYIGPPRLQSPVANDICMELASIRFSGNFV